MNPQVFPSRVLKGKITSLGRGKICIHRKIPSVNDDDDDDDILTCCYIFI
jgi:hypothetical protein